MKLITETVKRVQVLKENSGQYFVSGIFMQAEAKNRNGRIYPAEILKREVARYTKEYINENRALGELGHPEDAVINLERVSHLIKELSVEGSNIMGKAKILDTPYGKIVKTFIDEGVTLGISSRGMGSLRQLGNGTNEVQDDFYLVTADLVADPSAPAAFVDGIMEGREWIMENGQIKALEFEKYRDQIKKAKKTHSTKKLQEVAEILLEDYLSKL